MTEESAEIVYYQQGTVTITDKRAVLGEKTYALSNITTVSKATKPPSGTVGLAIIAFGLAVGFCVMQNSRWGGIFIMAVTALPALYYMFTAKPSYTVRIGSASGEADALESKDEDHIQAIVNAMNKAIIERK